MKTIIIATFIVIVTLGIYKQAKAQPLESIEAMRMVEERMRLVEKAMTIE